MAFWNRTGFKGLPGERRLASTTLADGGHSVATTRRLVVLRDQQPVHRWDWEDLRSASWDGPEYTLTVTPAVGDPVALVIPDKGNLGWASVVRERIQASVVTWRAAKVGGKEVRVVARHRRRGLTLDVELAPGLSGDSAAVTTVVDRLRAQVADDVGQPELRTSPRQMR